MKDVIVYRNGYIEVIKDFNCYVMSYFRQENNRIRRVYKSDYQTALHNFKKVINTEGF